MLDQPVSLSLIELRREIEELRKDHAAFVISYDQVCNRIRESAETNPSRQPQLHEWSGSRAICGSFEMSIHAIDRTITEYEDLINKVVSGEIANSDKPSLCLVGDHDE